MYSSLLNTSIVDCLCDGLANLPMILVLSLMTANEPQHVGL
jgi:hypothetical protein